MQLINGVFVDDERLLLEELGATNIESETLVNNYRYTFEYKDNKFTLAHILNVYGESVDFWELYIKNDGKTTIKTFRTQEQAIEFLKGGQQ